MLTRVCTRRRPVFLIRRLSDKIGDGKTAPPEPENETESKPTRPSDTSESARANASTDKIQALLKSMMEANKAKEAKSKQQFSTAPGIFKKHKQKPVVTEVKEDRMEETIVAAAGEVAATLGGDVKQTESELLSKVLGKVTQAPPSLSDLITGMKIDRNKEPEDSVRAETRGQQVRRLVDSARARQDMSGQGQNTRFAQRREQPARERRDDARSMVQVPPTDIFNSEGLGIFKSTTTSSFGTRLDTWEMLKQRELTLATMQPPNNYFQKMIQWTEQGKVWKFPLDNEQGLEEEAKVHFSEHIFLDTHLEGWCPQKGPIRHFMELVCVGLSKNPFYTAQEKKETILWYKEYFMSKKDMLTEIGALGSPTSNKPETNA